jgi:hypothetical protein
MTQLLSFRASPGLSMARSESGTICTSPPFMRRPVSGSVAGIVQIFCCKSTPATALRQSGQQSGSGIQTTSGSPTPFCGSAGRGASPRDDRSQVHESRRCKDCLFARLTKDGAVEYGAHSLQDTRCRFGFVEPDRLQNSQHRPRGKLRSLRRT